MRTMIAVPCMDQVQTGFFRSCLGMEVCGEVQWTTSQSSLIYDSRNKLLDLALESCGRACRQEQPRPVIADLAACVRELCLRCRPYADQGGVALSWRGNVAALNITNSLVEAEETTKTSEATSTPAASNISPTSSNQCFQPIVSAHKPVRG